MAKNINVKTLEITPEVKEMLKKNYFFVNKAKLPSFFAQSMLFAYFFVGLFLFILLYFRPTVYTYLLATISLVIAFIYIFRWLKPYTAQVRQYKLQPTTDQMEKWLIEDLRDHVKKSAVDMLSLNPATITPENFIIVPYPVWWEVTGVPPEHIARRRAGEYYVYATYGISILALTENYISYYSCIFDWLNNALVKPYTLEFFFDDISSIRVEEKELDFVPFDYEPPEIPEPEEKSEEEENEEAEKQEIPEPEEPPKVGSAKIVVVRNKSGETMDIISNIPELEASHRISLKTEKVMQTLRIMLRNRRYGEEFLIPKKEENNKKTEENNE